MSEINGKKVVLWTAGILVSILFWVFCITFTVTVISKQNEQIDANNANKETVTVYIEINNGNASDGQGNVQEQATQAVTERPTTNLDKYYMIDKAGNYVKGTLPYGNK